MAKGQIAKELVAKKIAEAFGNDYIGEIDKKFYVWSQENGSKMQVCISMTIPKNPVGEAGTSDIGGNGILDFENMPVGQSISEPAEVTKEEVKLAEDLLARLGL